MAILIAGAVLAIPAALAIGSFAALLLFEMKGNDLVDIAAATVGVALVSLDAGYFPARRAMKIDATVALRYE